MRAGRGVGLLATRMSSPPGFVTCFHCKSYFAPDPRNHRHQRFCQQPACRVESKRQAQARWLAKAENKNHFKGPVQVDRVRQWRLAHPGYWKRSQAKPTIALQDVCDIQPVEPQPLPSDLFAAALQDLSLVQTPLLVGLISQTLGSTLQDDIARHILGLVAKGQDLMDSPSRKSMQRSLKKSGKRQQKRDGAAS